MDDKRFDALAKTLVSGASRRGIAKGAVGGALAGVLARLAAGAGTAQERGAGAEHCAANGQKCDPARRLGTGHLHPCDRCCSDYSVRVRDGKRRCACKPAGEACRGGKAFQCCSGVCNGGFCTGRGELVERGEGASTVGSAPGCQGTDAGCTEVFEGTVEGRPIDGSFTATLTAKNFRQGEGQSGSEFTSDVNGTIELVDESSGDTLELEVQGQQEGDGETGEFTFTGTYTITGGTGRFVGASGTGEAFASGTDDGLTTTLDVVRLRGTVTTVG